MTNFVIHQKLPYNSCNFRNLRYTQAQDTNTTIAVSLFAICRLFLHFDIIVDQSIDRKKRSHIMSTVTGAEVWSKVSAEKLYSGYSPEVLAAIQPFIVHLPEILSDQLDRKVTFLNLMKAQLTFLQCCDLMGYCKAVVDAGPKKGKNEWHILVEILESQQDLWQKIEKLAGITTLQRGPYFSLPAQEGLYMVTNIAFNSETESLYQNGELTIGRLLELQPIIIVDTTPLDLL